MADIAQWFDEVLPEVGGVSTPLLTNAVRNSMREFLKRSTIWREDLTPITLVATTGTYTVSVGTGTVLADIIKAKIDDEREIKPILPGDLEREYPNWQFELGEVKRYLMENTSSVIRLIRTPEIEHTLDLKVALMPGATGTSIPDWIFEQYFEPIGYGAKHRLMRMAGFRWSNPDAASMYFTLFENAIGDAQSAADKGLTTGPLRTYGYHSLPEE